MTKTISGLIESPASLFIYAVGFVFAVVVAYQMITNQPVAPAAVGFVTTVVGQAIMTKGTQHGVDVTNDTVNKVATAQLPATQVAVDQAMAVNAKKATDAESSAPVASVKPGDIVFPS